MDNKIFVLITRMSADIGSTDDEFVQVWDGNENDPSKVKKFDEGEINKYLILIHGHKKIFPEQILHAEIETQLSSFYKILIDELNKIEGVNYSVGIAFHPYHSWGENETLFSDWIRNLFTKLNYKLEFIRDYHEKELKGDLIINVKEDSALNKKLFDNQWKIFFLDKLKLISKLSNIKHNLINLFISINVDLQGLTESQREKKFREDYWGEVVDSLQGKSLKDLFSRSREMLYASSGELTSVAKIVEDATSKSPDRTLKLIPAWEMVQALLPPDKIKGQQHTPEHLESRDLFIQARKILEAIAKGKKEDAERECAGTQGNPFNIWLTKLDDALDYLREVLYQIDVTEEAN